MLERLKLPTDLQALVAPFIPTSTYLLEDLARFSPEALAARADLSVALRVAYFILQRSRAASALEDELQLIVDDLRVLSQDPGFRDYLTRLLSYTFETANGDMDAVHALPRKPRPFHGDPNGNPHAEGIREGLVKGLQEGRSEGIQEGRTEGIQEGLLNGQREVLARQLALKFGVLPRPATERIARATRDELVEYSCACSLPRPSTPSSTEIGGSVTREDVFQLRGGDGAADPLLERGAVGGVDARFHSGGRTPKRLASSPRSTLRRSLK
jgi:hypothetical protein